MLFVLLFVPRKRKTILCHWQQLNTSWSSFSAKAPLILWLCSEHRKNSQRKHFSILSNNGVVFATEKTMLYSCGHSMVQRPISLLSCDQNVWFRIALLSYTYFCFESVFSIAVFIFTLSFAERSINTLPSLSAWAAFNSMFPPTPLHPSLRTALKSPAAFHEQRRSLERARVSESWFLWVDLLWWITININIVHINSTNHKAVFFVHCGHLAAQWQKVGSHTNSVIHHCLGIKLRKPTEFLPTVI